MRLWMYPCEIQVHIKDIQHFICLILGAKKTTRHLNFEFWHLRLNSKCTQLNKRLYPNTRKQEDRKLCQIFLEYVFFKTILYSFIYKYHEFSDSCYDKHLIDMKIWFKLYLHIISMFHSIWMNIYSSKIKVHPYIIFRSWYIVCELHLIIDL